MTNQRRLIAALFITVLISLTFLGCSNNMYKMNNEPLSKTEFLLGTVVTIKIYDNGSQEILNRAFNKLKEIEGKMTINSENSEVIEINSKAGKDFVKVSDDTFHVISRGKYFSELSRGRFDISIGPLVKLWNIGGEDVKVPTVEEIEDRKKLVDFNNVILDEEEKSVMLKEEGMILDLGGIAKGYGADEVVSILKEEEVGYAIINIGGNVFAYGNKPDGTPWKVGIQNPQLPGRGDHIGIVKLVNQSIVTSGIYERYIEEKGKRYHHILDPESGYPVENNLVGVSVVADSSIDADSLSTSVFALGLNEGMELIEGLENVEGLFITTDSQVHVSSGLRERFKLTDSKFQLVP